LNPSRGLSSRMLQHFLVLLVRLAIPWQCASEPVGTDIRQRGNHTASRRPNILFLLVDDWGHGDVDACPYEVPFELCPFRARSSADARAFHVRTPRIKEMATQGMIFTNWYAPRSICTPSRAALMTGRDPIRYGVIDALFRIFPASGARGGLPQSEVTTAEYLRALNYTTGYAGKWHLGGTNGVDPTYYAPWNHGFDEVSFFIEGSNGEPCHKGSQNPPNDNNLYHMCTYSHIQNQSGDVVEQPIRWENITSRMLM